MEKKRSKGVTIFGIVSILIGLLPLYLFTNELLWIIEDLGRPDVEICIFQPYLIFLAIATIGFILAGIFMLRLKNWARILFLLLMGCNILLGLGGVYLFGPLCLAPGISRLAAELAFFLVFSLLPFLVSIYYLTRPKVKEQFK